MSRPPENLLMQFFGIVGTWHRRSRDRRALSAMGERELRDIGLDRRIVESESSKPFWRA